MLLHSFLFLQGDYTISLLAKLLIILVKMFKMLVPLLVILSILSSLTVTADAQKYWKPDTSLEHSYFSRDVSSPPLVPKKGRLIDGCRLKPLETSLLGTAKACPAKKPMKPTKALKTAKGVCAEDWQICSMIRDKGVQQLSWKTHKMPRGCYALHSGKGKPAGYGKHCNVNLYFDGVLCCPKPGTKAHHHSHSHPKQTHHFLSNHLFNDHENNVIE